MHRELRRPEAEDKSQGRSCGASCNAIDRRQAAQPAVLLALELNAAIAALVAQINKCASHHLGTSRRAPRLFDPQSRLKHQLVTARGSNKDGRSSGIFFDFLP
jgi:hypothetical protein